MERKHALAVGAAVAGAAALAFWWIQKQNEDARTTPDWGDPRDPATGVGGQPTSPFPAGPDPVASFHASRPGTPHMRAGSRIKRDYAANLVDDPESLVR